MKNDYKKAQEIAKQLGDFLIQEVTEEDPERQEILTSLRLKAAEIEYYLTELGLTNK